MNKELFDVERRALRAEIAEQKIVIRDLLETMERFAKCDLNDGNCASVGIAARRIRNTAQVAINKAQDGSK